MTNGAADPKFITQEDFNSLQKEVKALEEAHLKQKELIINSTSISKSDLKELKAEIIMWVVGIMIAFGALIFVVLNQKIDGVSQRISGVDQRVDGVSQRIDKVNQRIDDIKEDINANKIAIAENKAMIQKVLDKLDDLDDQKQN